MFDLSSQSLRRLHPVRVVRRLLRMAGPTSLPVERVLAPLEEPFRSALLSMYRNEPQLGLDGERHPTEPSVRIPPAQGMCLYDMCRKSQPRTLVEIGTSYGYSTLFFLAAIAKNGLGQLISIDPHVRSFAHGIALASVTTLRVGSSFRYLEERSDRAAVDLARECASFEFIFIDGSHRFDDVLTDFYLFAPLCASGCYVVFDDLWMPSIQSAVSFVRINRADFQERPTPEPNIAVFQKVGLDSRSWDHFRPFSVSRDSGGSQ